MELNNKIKINQNIVLAICLILAIVFSIIQLVKSAAPNPGHSWSEVGDEGTEALPANRGGTGQTSLTANSVSLGNDTNPVQLVAPGTSGNVLTSNGTTWQSAAPSILSGTLVLLYSNETDVTVNNSNAENNFTGKNWTMNIPPSTYTYYLLEAEVSFNAGNNINRNVSVNWRFNEGTSLIKAYNWRQQQSNISGIATGISLAATLTVLINNSLPANANLKLSGTMNNANLNTQMTAHSFRVYGIR